MIIKRFLLKEEHLKLFSRQYVSWDHCEFGAAVIDCKRPYGNSDVISDMMDILGHSIKECSYCGSHTTKHSVEYYRQLHSEMKTVLEIVIHNTTKGTIKPGWYTKPQYGGEWLKEPEHNQD